jgi:hypothetical protein
MYANPDVKKLHQGKCQAAMKCASEQEFLVSDDIVQLAGSILARRLIQLA